MLLAVVFTLIDVHLLNFMQYWLHKLSFLSEQENELLIGWHEADVIAVEVQSTLTNTNFNPDYNMEDLWTNWHRHCFTWKASKHFMVCLFIEMFCFRSSWHTEFHQ